MTGFETIQDANDPRIKVGAVVRHLGMYGAFCDSVITRIEEGKYDDIVHLARPHIYVSTIGTPMMTYEQFPVERHRLVNYFAFALTGPSGNVECRLEHPWGDGMIACHEKNPDCKKVGAEKASQE